MADICMCKGHGCPKKDKCYRYTEKVGMWQSYFLETPINKDNNECEYCWEERDEKNR